MFTNVYTQEKSHMDVNFVEDALHRKVTCKSIEKRSMDSHKPTFFKPYVKTLILFVY
jgi:hypothetical protein